jgi:GNAT superfamily N-acetyltransferase
VEAVRRESWRVAYAGLIGKAYIERATAGPSGISHPAPWRRTLVAVADGSRAAADESPAVAGSSPGVVGYTAFGPERSGLAPQPGRAKTDPLPLTPAGLAGEVGEVYAIYVAPDWWSTGTGRLLMEAAVASLLSAGYRRAVLWVLDTNARARRFYERAGWAPDGAANTMAALGGVVEVRYTRPLL